MCRLDQSFNLLCNTNVIHFRFLVFFFIDLLIIFAKSIDLDALHNELLRKKLMICKFHADPFFQVSRIVVETFYPLSKRARETRAFWT